MQIDDSLFYINGMSFARYEHCLYRYIVVSGLVVSAII